MPGGDPQPNEVWSYRRGCYEEVTIIKVDPLIIDDKCRRQYDTRYPRVTAKKADGRELSWATIHFVDIFIYVRQADDSGGGSSSSSTAQSAPEVEIVKTCTEQEQLDDAQRTAEEAGLVIDLTGEPKKKKTRKGKLLEKFKLRF